MIQKDKFTLPPIDSAALIERLLLGGGIALIALTFFLLGVNHPKPEWGKLWMLKPLLVVPLAGALGGTFSYVMEQLCYQSGRKKVLAIAVSLPGYIIAVWLGTALGLNGTLWD